MDVNVCSVRAQALVTVGVDPKELTEADEFYGSAALKAYNTFVRPRPKQLSKVGEWKVCTHRSSIYRFLAFMMRCCARALSYSKYRYAHKMYITVYKCVCLAYPPFFLCRPRVFSRALGSGARREPVRTPQPKCGPWPRSVARALGV